jgi:site-specific recombinase XerD|tara:strand:+ start:81 stop:1418 length:1338 start_codon:yes stop_codon:yes gene_type:complete
MTGSVWVQNKIELFEGELVVFKRANSPNWYMRVYIQKEGKHYQKSCRTKSQYVAMEFAKAEYRELQTKVAKEEKVFTIDLITATEEYFEQEKNRERRGLIKNDWVKKKEQYLRNTFMKYMGSDRKVNDISNKDFELYVDYRLRVCKRKETIRQELVIIKHFYKTLLLKQGYVFKIPEIPEFKIREKDRAKRDDTFTLKEWDKLVRFMREWVKEKNISQFRNPVKEYGKKENTLKKMNAMEYSMEKHRRAIIRELILIASNSGLRCPKEILSLTWGDIKLRKQEMENMYGRDEKSQELVAVVKVNDEQKTGSRVVICLAGTYFKRLRQYYVETFDYTPKNNDPVFLEMYGRRKGSQLDKYALYRIWGELMRDAGLDRIKFTLYHLRHFAITQQILNGVDLLLIAKNMGNSINTIAKHYEHIDMEKNSRKLIQRRNTRLEMTEEENW